MNRFVCASLMVLAACKGEEAAKPAPVSAKTVEPAQAPAAAPSDDGLANKPKQRVTIERLRLSLEVPEGTTVSPPREADDATSAHLEQGKFMLNLRSVDEFSTPSFLEAQKVHSSDKLLASIRAEETPTGWITVREIKSALHKRVVVEMSVRTEVAGKKWDCSVAAPNRAYADLALAACQSLAPMTATSAEAAAKSAAPKPAAKKPPTKANIAKASTVKPAGGSVQGGLSKDVIGKVIRGAHFQLQRCHERGSRSEASVNALFVIGANGKVSSISASGADTKLSRCVASVFRGFSFPAPADGKPVKVAYPIRFAGA